MTVSCKLCRASLETAAAGAERQVMDLLEKMGAHLRNFHPDQAREMTFALAVVSTHLLFDYIEIPETSALMREQREHGRAAVERILQMGSAGFAFNPRAGEIH